MRHSLARSRKLASVAEAVGDTPLVRLRRVAREAPSVEVYAKLGFLARLWPGYTYFFNPDAYAAVGIHYMFSKGFGLKAEAGYPGIRVGIVLAF